MPVVRCRKQSGAPFVPFLGGIPTASLTWSAPPKVWKATEIAERGFCDVCGSLLFMRYFRQPDTISITAGTLDGEYVPHSGLVKEDIYTDERMELFERYK